MPTTTTYSYESTALAITMSSIGGESSISVDRKIVRIDGSTINLTTEETLMQTEGVLQAQGSAYTLSPPSGMTWQQFARYRGHTLTHLPNKAVNASLKWSTLLTVDPTSTSPIRYALPSATEYTSRARTAKFYRVAWSVNPPAGSDTSADIVGTAAAGGFQGIDGSVAQMSVRLRIVFDASIVPMDTAAVAALAYSGMISSATFLGFPAGSMVCEGVSLSRREHEYYDVVFDFLYDAYYHHEQVATVAEDGHPKISATGPVEVKWKRLPRTAANFNTIYGGDTNLQTQAENGWWS